MTFIFLTPLAHIYLVLGMKLIFYLFFLSENKTCLNIILLASSFLNDVRFVLENKTKY